MLCLIKNKTRYTASEKVNKQRQKSFAIDKKFCCWQKKRAQKAVNNAVFLGSLKQNHIEYRNKEWSFTLVQS